MIEDAEGRRLARYLAGECSAEEAAEVRAWIERDPTRARIVDEIAAIWRVSASSPAPRVDDVEEAWKEFIVAREARRVRSLHAEAAGSGQTATLRWHDRRPRAGWWARVAAAIAICIGAGLMWRATVQDGRGGSSAGASTDSVHVYATRRGERAEFRLSDGSRVRLGVDSRLWIPADFGATVRTVNLTGEAYFEVIHDTTRPFRVHAGGTVTEDLGTIFGVRAYADEPVQVVVAEGSVAVRDPKTHDAAVLRPRDLATVGIDRTMSLEHDVDPAAYLGWTAGRLIFQYSSFSDVVKELERRFDLRVTVQDSTLLAAKVSATFDDDNLNDVLSVLARTLDVRIERHGSSVVVHRHD